ncbi:MAG: aminotransferase class III-fold pyridoxal phosphate-dependent enzyme, partial [Mesorhizobium sp.]
LWHVSNLYEIPGQSRLGERLADATFADKVFFTNSGAEALECAIKTARRYHFVRGHPERFRIITFEGAFHGRTLATIAAGGQYKYLEGGFLEDVQRKALLLKQGLAGVADEFPDVIEDIRGSGLMLGLKCAAPNTKVNMALRDQHLLAVPAGDNVLRLLPPLTVTDAEIHEA